jgi:hypothetical protein
MTKKNPDTLVAICEMVASTGIPPKKAALQLGVSASSYHSWITQCGKNPEDWMIEFAGEMMSFNQGLALARRLRLMDALAEFERRCTEGDTQILTYKGKISWVEDEELVKLDDQTLDQLGYPDRYKRDENGHRIPQTIPQPPPVAAVIKLLESNFRAYAQRSTVDINQKTQISGGVVVGGANAVKLPPVTIVAPPPITIAPPAEITDAEIEEPEPETDTVSEIEPAPTPEPEPAPVVEAPPTKPLTALQRDLLERLKRRPANPQPRDIVKVFRVDASEDRAEQKNIEVK